MKIVSGKLLDTIRSKTMSNKKRFIHYLVREKRKILLGVFFTVLMGFIQILTGALLKLLSDSIENYISKSDGTVSLKLTLPFLKQKITVIKTLLEGNEEIFQGLLYLGLAYLSFSLFELLFEYFREVFMQSAAQRILQKFKSDIYSKVLRLPYAFYYKTKTGDLISRITYDVSTMTDIINLFIEFTRSLVYLVVLLPVMFFIDWKITSIVIIFFPISFIVINWIIKRIEIISKGITDNVGDYTAFLDEKINNFRLVKIFGQEEKERTKFDNLIEKNYQLTLKNIRLISFLKPSNQFLGIVGLVLVFIFFDYQMVFSTESPGNAVFYLYILSQAFKPIKKLARSVGQLQVAVVSIKKIFNFLATDEETDINDNDNSTESESIDEVTFKNVSFCYQNNKKAIDDISFSIKAGEILAITGSSGSGKTTLVKLLARFFNNTEGTILINHLNLKSFRLKYLRRKIVIVNQHTGVFEGSIADNLFYGVKTIDDTRIETLKKILHINDLNEEIMHLSEGQKKIIAIFRAMIFQPDIIILDEVFEAIDKDVIDELFTLMKSISLIIIITRHDRIIQKADKLLELKDGTIKSFNSIR